MDYTTLELPLLEEKVRFVLNVAYSHLLVMKQHGFGNAVLHLFMSFFLYIFFYIVFYLTQHSDGTSLKKSVTELAWGVTMGIARSLSSKNSQPKTHWKEPQSV